MPSLYGMWQDFAAGILYDPASNNRGANGRYWTELAEPQTDRFGWTSNYDRLESFNTTPAEEGGRYLSNAEKDQALASARIPTTPRSR